MTTETTLEGKNLTKEEFDPLTYIENSFLDRKGEAQAVTDTVTEGETEGVAPVVRIRGVEMTATIIPDSEDIMGKKRFRRTTMSAPRPRRAKKQESTSPRIDPNIQAVWESLPRNIEFLCSFYDDAVTANYYGGEFKESRQELIRRLLDPELSLEETSRLLGVCPATVRRYTNRGWLTHHRTQGGQRRFRLGDIVRFVELHGRFPEE